MAAATQAANRSARWNRPWPFLDRKFERAKSGTWQSHKGMCMLVTAAPGVVVEGHGT
jgi:hypothetical protein